MLNTLLKIGQWQSKGATEWERFLDKPKVISVDKKDNRITNYTLPIVFDLDKMEVIIDPANLKEYDESDVIEFKALKIQGGNNKAIYATVPSTKFIQLYKTFFGKEGVDEATKGELVEAIDKSFPEFQKTTIYSILQKIFLLKRGFTETVSYEDEKKNGKEISVKAIERTLNLQKSDNLALIYISLKSAEYGLASPKPFSKLEEYEKLLETKFIGEKGGNEAKITEKSLCYASGSLEDGVEALDLTNRYSLNKMFVTETRNYASFFDRDNFRINYQVSKKNQERLDYASTFLLDNYKTKIANIDHVIIPQFLDHDNIDLEKVLGGIKRNSDLLFNLKEELDKIVNDVETETENIFWINFVAYESDGNFFKSTEIIKDVSRFHFQKLIQEFVKVHWEMRDAEFVNWESVMTDYGKVRIFNLNSIYNIIPIRKDKEKKNVALDLFKALLENRRIEITQLYGHFKELLLCHYFKRYKSYTNIRESSSEYFSKAIKDSIFRYLAFIEVLRNLNLIKMESTNDQKEISEPHGKYDETIVKFFERMDYNASQKALFYLGRMLSAVVYLQKDKNKTVLDKVNYNGMDRDDLIRLRTDLLAKAKQYGEIKKLLFTDSKFGEQFNFGTWNIDPNEALFFLFTGFSFVLKSNSDKDQVNN